MESNRMFSGMLGLEMAIHQNPNQQPQNPNPNPNNMHHPQMVANYGHNHNQQPQQSAKQLYPYSAKAKEQVAVSDEDEPDDGIADGKKKMSPWQRMKWTDNMVRLLIVAVYYIGDEAGPEVSDLSGKKKGGGAGLLQKKGKWKSVSRAMMEKGFYVSPQQCEDKFNDLNKRYKRVNDILGKGTACRVVENQGLLESMDLSVKMKEEVRKLLNSKHLFFREMCAYHNSCGHSGAGGAQQSPEGAACFHSSENPPTGKLDTDTPKMAKVGSSDDEDEDEDEDSEHKPDEDDDDDDGRFSRKRPRPNTSSPSLSFQQFGNELTSMLQDGAKSQWEKKNLIKARLMQLEEQQIEYQCQAFELEKQRLKWMKFSSKKEREMDRAKLENERRRLENERMVLVVKQKELELVDLIHSTNRKADPSSITG